MMKGITLLYMVLMGRLHEPANPNKFMPNGGVMNPISDDLHISTPYHIGLNPSSAIVGKMIGSVSTMIELFKAGKINQARKLQLNQQRK